MTTFDERHAGHRTDRAVRKGVLGERRCLTCECARSRARYHETQWNGGWPTRFLWEDDAYEYKFMRHELGMTLADIARKAGIKEKSLIRALERKGISP